MQVTHTHDGIIVGFTKSELLEKYSSEQYLCFRISWIMKDSNQCGNFYTKNWYDRIKDQNVICDFLIGLLAREMDVAPETLYCSAPRAELVEKRGIFGLINSTAAKYIQEHYDFWLYDFDNPSVAITSDYFSEEEYCGWCTYRGDRTVFINSLIEKNMRDDEKLIVTFRKDS